MFSSCEATAERLSREPWFGGGYWTHWFGGYGSRSLTIFTEPIKDKDAYDKLVCSLTEHFPSGFVKDFAISSLILKQKSSYDTKRRGYDEVSIFIRMPNTLISEIMECELVETEHRYKSLSCKVK